MNQNNKLALQQIQTMLSKLSDHIFQINSIILEINNMINQINITYENNQNNFIQMNNNIPFNPLNFNMNLNPFFNQLYSEPLIKQKINVTFDFNNNKTNLVLDDNISINEMLILFLKRIGKEDYIGKNEYRFIYSGEIINFDDKRQIKDLKKTNSNYIVITVFQKI